MADTDKYDAIEQERLIAIFTNMLWQATRDGGKKRAAGTKLPWNIDPTHEAALFSHLNKWKHGETVDPDSGAHPLVHLAWRALAIACKETGNVPKPKVDPEVAKMIPPAMKAELEDAVKPRVPWDEPFDYGDPS